MSRLLLGAEVADGLGASQAMPLAPGGNTTGLIGNLDAERLANAEAEKRKEKTNLWEGFQKAYKQNTGWMFENNEIANDLIDPNYTHTLDKHKALLKEAGALPEHYAYFNQPIYSQKHAELLVGRYKESRANDMYMGDMGLAGSIAVNLAAGVLDPMNLVTGAMTGGVAYAYKAYKVAQMAEAGMAAANAGYNLSKTALAVRGAVAGAAENMFTETLQSGYRPTWSTDDLLWAGAFGAAFGGAGALAGAALKASSAEHVNVPDLGGENRAIRDIGDKIELESLRDAVKTGEVEVTPEIAKIINDPTHDNPVSEVGRLAAESEKRIKQIEDEIAAREAEIKAADGFDPLKTPLVDKGGQMKSAEGLDNPDYTHLLPEKALGKLRDAEAGTVVSDLRAAPVRAGEDVSLKGERSGIVKALNETADKWLKEFLPDMKMYLTSNAGALSASAVKGVYGVTARLADNIFQITIPQKHLKDKQAFSTLAHEIGHNIVDVHFYRAPFTVRDALYKEYQDFLKKSLQATNPDEVKYTRFTPDHAEKVYIPNGAGKTPAEGLAGSYKKNYIYSFDEYMAERFAMYVQHKDMTLPQMVREYFDIALAKLKALFGKAEGYLKTGTTVEKFFDDIKAGKYRDAPSIMPKDVSKEVERLKAEVEKLKGDLGIEKQSYAAYDNFLKSGTAEALSRPAPEAVMGNVRFDISGLLLTSQNPIVRRIGSLLVSEAVGLKNGAVQRMTAEEGQKILQRQFEVKFYREFDTLMNGWVAEKNLSLAERFSARRLFSEEVGRTIMGFEPNPSPQAKKMAEAYSKLMVEYTEHINDVGKLEGKQLGGLRKEPLKADPGYFTRLHDMQKWHEFMSRPEGLDLAHRFFKGAMMKANEWLSDTLAEKIAKTYVRKVRGMELEEYSGFDRAFSGQDLDELRRILDEQGLLTKGEIDDVVFQMKAMNGGDNDAPVNSRMKRRAMLDTSHVMEVNGERITLENFVNTNAEEVFASYNRMMSGAVSLARVGIRTKAEFDKMILQVADSAKAIPGYFKSHRMKAEIESMEFAYKRIAGIPTTEESMLSQAAGMMQKYNFIRLMGQMGLAQMQELSGILGQMGVKTALRAMPTLSGFLRDVRTGKLADNVLDELEVAIGSGADILKGHNVSDRWMDDVGGFMRPETNRVVNSVDTMLNRGINTTMMVSGFRAANVLLQRWASKALAQKFTDAAFGADHVIKAEFRQMMGMDDAMYQRVLDQLRKHSTTEQGALFGRNIKALNLNKWDDAQAAGAFTTGIFRWSRRMVQENDIGSMHRYMGTTAGQIIGQFRSFTINAWSKSTLWGIHNRNSEMLMSLVWGTGISALIYAGRLYVNSAGRDDREAYLEKNLSLGKVVANGVSRTAQASLLPGLIDSTVAPAFGTQFFSESRTSGLAAGTGAVSDALGNPTLDLLNKLANAPKAMHDVVTGESNESAPAIRRTLSMLPFQNVIGVQQGLNALATAAAD